MIQSTYKNGIICVVSASTEPFPEYVASYNLTKLPGGVNLCLSIEISFIAMQVGMRNGDILREMVNSLTDRDCPVIDSIFIPLKLSVSV